MAAVAVPLQYPSKLHPDGKEAYGKMVAKAWEPRLISLITIAWRLKFPPRNPIVEFFSKQKTLKLRDHLRLLESQPCEWSVDHLKGEMTLEVKPLHLHIELYYSNWGLTSNRGSYQVVYMAHGLRTDELDRLLEHLKSRVLRPEQIKVR